jgi:hypothetical protein
VKSLATARKSFKKFFQKADINNCQKVKEGNISGGSEKPQCKDFHHQYRRRSGEESIRKLA